MPFIKHSVYIAPKFRIHPADQVLSTYINFTLTTFSPTYFSSPLVTSTIELTDSLQAPFEVAMVASIDPYAVIFILSSIPSLLPTEARLEPPTHPRMAIHDIPAYPDFSCLDMIAKDDADRFSPGNDFATLFTRQYLPDQ